MRSNIFHYKSYHIPTPKCNPIAVMKQVGKSCVGVAVYNFVRSAGLVDLYYSLL